MIVEYTPEGRIMHVVLDPVPAAMFQILSDMGKTYLNVPPTKMPDELLRDEDGNQVFETISQAVVIDHVPQMDEQGNQQFEDVQVPSIKHGAMVSAQISLMTDYIEDGMVKARPVLSIPEAVSLNVGQMGVVGGLPSPCRILVDGAEHILEDGELEIEGEMPAEYEIVFDQFPYMPATMKVTIHEA
ncbi:hypothetical protein [Agrobacterium sp. CG674]